MRTQNVILVGKTTTPLQITPLQITPLQITRIQITPLQITPLQARRLPSNPDNMTSATFDSYHHIYASNWSASSVREGSPIYSMPDRKLGTIFFLISRNLLFLTQFLCQATCTHEPQRDPNNRRLNEHGIYIRYCQESNSQPVSSQAGADNTRPQWRTDTFTFKKQLKPHLFTIAYSTLYVLCSTIVGAPLVTLCVNGVWNDDNEM